MKREIVTTANVPIEIELFKPDTQWVSSRNSFPYADGNYFYKQNDDFSKPVDCDMLSFSCSKVEKTGGVSSFSKVCLKFDDAFKEEALLLKSQLTSLLRCSVSIRMKKKQSLN